MAWFKKERKPRISQRTKLEIPKDAWERCENCGHVDIRERFERALNVCTECGHHRRFTAEEYIELLTDAGHLAGVLRQSPLAGSPQLRDTTPTASTAAEKKAGTSDAIYTGFGRLEGIPYHLGVMNFAFMGGSMGSVVGEKIARLARAIGRQAPAADPGLHLGRGADAGGRALADADGQDLGRHRPAQAGRRFRSSPCSPIPTTGGVSASFAMQGDAILAEPGAVIGFAGQRVIKQTIGQDLPEGFQTAEFLLEQGQIDDVVPRGSLRETDGAPDPAHAGAGGGAARAASER